MSSTKARKATPKLSAAATAEPRASLTPEEKQFRLQLRLRPRTQKSRNKPSSSRAAENRLAQTNCPVSVASCTTAGRTRNGRSSAEWPPLKQALPESLAERLEQVSFHAVGDLGQLLLRVLQKVRSRAMRFKCGIVFVLLVDEEAAGFGFVPVHLVHGTTWFLAGVFGQLLK